MKQPTELEMLQAEKKRLLNEKAEAEARLQAKMDILRTKLSLGPARLKANHPILTFLATHTYGTAKNIAKAGIKAIQNEYPKAAKGLAKAAKGTGKELFHGIKVFGKYALEKKAQEQRRLGNNEEAARLEARARRIRV